MRPRCSAHSSHHVVVADKPVQHFLSFWTVVYPTCLLAATEQAAGFGHGCCAWSPLREHCEHERREPQYRQACLQLDAGMSTCCSTSSIIGNIHVIVPLAGFQRCTMRQEGQHSAVLSLRRCARRGGGSGGGGHGRPAVRSPCKRSDIVVSIYTAMPAPSLVTSTALSRRAGGAAGRTAPSSRQTLQQPFARCDGVRNGGFRPLRQLPGCLATQGLPLPVLKQV